MGKNYATGSGGPNKSSFFCRNINAFINKTAIDMPKRPNDLSRNRPNKIIFCFLGI